MIPNFGIRDDLQEDIIHRTVLHTIVSDAILSFHLFESEQCLNELFAGLFIGTKNNIAIVCIGFNCYLG